MISLLLVRHGEAEHHIREITGGWTDSDLTETGLRQVNLLAARLCEDLSGQPVTLISSNLRRAVHTAHILGALLGVQPGIHPEITDLNNGKAAGMTHSQAKAIATPPSEPYIDWQPYPQAETWRQFHLRVSEYMRVNYSSPTGMSVLVSHAATIHVIVAWWLQLPVDSPTHFEIAPASITTLGFNQWGERMLERMNDCTHLVVGGFPHAIRG